jgi:hypothetical protein
MMYIESTSASPLTTRLGGTCCNPSALRTRASTITIFANDVTMIAMKGASDSSPNVSRMTTGSGVVAMK